MTQERSINLGSGENRDYPNNAFTESHMLTGDENIVDINLTIVWKIKDAKDYLFSMRSPDATVSVAAQSVLREIVGQSEMQPIITGDRGKVEDDTKDELQRVLDEFGAGIQIVRVKLQKQTRPEKLWMRLMKCSALKPIWNVLKTRRKPIVMKFYQRLTVKLRRFYRMLKLIRQL